MLSLGVEMEGNDNVSAHTQSQTGRSWVHLDLETGLGTLWVTALVKKEMRAHSVPVGRLAGRAACLKVEPLDPSRGVSGIGLHGPRCLSVQGAAASLSACVPVQGGFKETCSYH